MTLTDEPNTQFNYLLNAFEHASQADQPAEQGYGEKRRKLIAHVRELERQSAELAALREQVALERGRTALCTIERNELRELEKDAGRWQPIETAPKDGTSVFLHLRHTNWKYARDDAERAQWQEVVKARWIDHNGGGWTWYGLCGDAIAWMPIPAIDAAIAQQQGNPTRADAPVGR